MKLDMQKFSPKRMENRWVMKTKHNFLFFWKMFSRTQKQNSKLNSYLMITIIKGSVKNLIQ